MSMSFLIGMPGAGKTYWGQQLADVHLLPFVDLDSYIEEKHSKKIGQLFEDMGEVAFREIEHQALLEIVKNNTKPTIVACGGGTPCFSDNLQIMKSAGATVYIKNDMELLLQHLANEVQKRPLLAKQADLSKYLDNLLVLRKSYYEQADHILAAKNISIANFDKIISSCIGRH